jgi:hypothetical protein
MNAFYVCDLLSNYAKINPLDSNRVMLAISRIRKENRGCMNSVAFDLFGQTEEEFVLDLLDTMNFAESEESEISDE